MITHSNDILLEGLGTLEPYAPIAGVLLYPFIFRDSGHFQRVFQGPVGRALLTEIGTESHRHIVGVGYRGERYLTSNKKIHGLADLRGMKTRVPPLKMSIRTWEMLGAKPVPMGAPELYFALRQGVLEGAEVPFNYIEDFKLFEVQKYVVEGGLSYGAMGFMFEEERFRALPAAVQSLLTEEGERVMDAATTRMKLQEVQYMEVLRQKGIVVLTFDRNAFAARLAPLINEFPEMARWVKAIETVH